MPNQSTPMRPKDFIFITIAAVIMLAIIASLAGCNSVKTAIHKNQESSITKTDEETHLQHVIKADSTGNSSADSNYERETVIEYEPATTGNGTIVLSEGTSSDISRTLPASLYTNRPYVNTQIKKITIREKGTTHKMQAVAKSNVDSLTQATVKKEEVKKEVAVKDKDKKSSRVPWVGILVLGIVLACGLWAYKRYFS